ncbi:metal ABC transporter solute-binding protein, Zn/Mn family [Paludibacterium yongneupense]|uniref:metal ABC transporter solute-binding protein, Zn/Mn family n=1 Tax=Paludibacterium yongneupense TaxID=400061 RepID=UPI0004059DBA|nr:zinc ABC transporter substrate-binding protein [Paludibacterium yongneupense]
MSALFRLRSCAIVAGFALSATALAAPAVNIVAAENFYGDVVAQVGGPHVKVVSILNNPDQDPHLFEASPQTARAMSHADLVVYNGIDYDPWMEKMLAASPSTTRHSINVGALLHKKTGDNPHLWYDPATMPAVARALETELARIDPANKADYRRRLDDFLASLAPLNAKIAKLRLRAHGRPVAATEPVFGYMATALGLPMRNPRFQIAVMNDTEPSASDIAAFEQDLAQHRIAVLFYNSQASNPAASRVRTRALAAHIPVVGVTETAPAGQHYQGWMLSQLNALDRALPR